MENKKKMSKKVCPAGSQNPLLGKSVYWIVPLLCLLAALTNTSLFGAYWRWDDASILVHVHEFTLAQDFLNPEVWQKLSPSNLTPWLIVSYQVDLSLFGLHPSMFYLHQILAIAASGIALYVLLRLWVLPVFAIIGAVLYMVGTPVLLVAQQLMTRHYVEGMFFCLSALICFVIYLRNRSIPYLLVSVLSYLLAVTAKEVYVPLVVLLPFLPERDILLRCKSALPHVVVALVYVVWRSTMLSSLVGGYVDSGDYLSTAFIADVAESFVQFPSLLFGSWWLIVSLGYLLLFIAYSCTNRRAILLIILISILVLAPLAALVRFPGISIADRYLLLPWLVFSFSCAFFANFFFSVEGIRGQKVLRGGMILVIGVVFLSSLISAINTRRDVLISANQFDELGRFMWNQDNSVAFLPSDLVLSSLWYVTDLAELKRRLAGGQTAPPVIVDPKYIEPDAADSVVELMEYSAECQCMQVSEQTIDALLTGLEQRERDNAPLELSYTYQGKVFTWSFGPYETGAYHIVSDTIGVTQVPREGSQRVSLAENTRFYLRYTSPEGWVSYSEIQIVENGATPIKWSRTEL